MKLGDTAEVFLHSVTHWYPPFSTPDRFQHIALPLLANMGDPPLI